MLKKTKIVCTMGPSTEKQEIIENLLNSGMNVARFNFSHGDHAEHGNRINLVKAAGKATGKTVSLMLDTKGPEMRLGKFAAGKVQLVAGKKLILTADQDFVGDETKVAVSHKGLCTEVKPGDTILLSDGLVSLTVEEIQGTDIVTTIMNSGIMGTLKRVAAPGVSVNLPPLSDRDVKDVIFGISQDMDFIAASFVQRAADVHAIRKVITDNNGKMEIISKIENMEGVDNIDEIIEASDGIMVARGDLGVDVSFELVPIYQKKIIKTANAMGKPVVTATHMLESMQGNPRPTRAEASDVANAVLDGTDAIMLSGESAAGLYPIEAVQTMDRIAKAMEPTIPFRDRLKASIKTSQRTKNDAIAISVADTAMALDVAAVIAFTQSGTTARRISKFRPEAPVIAVTFDEKTQRSLAMNWGVTTVLSEVANNQNNECELARAIAKEMGIKVGETIIIVAGYPVGNGATNTMKIIEVK